MAWVVIALRQKVNNLGSSVVVRELELEINRALYVFMKRSEVSDRYLLI